jgi:hypothetical protein
MAAAATPAATPAAAGKAAGAVGAAAVVPAVAALPAPTPPPLPKMGTPPTLKGAAPPPSSDYTLEGTPLTLNIEYSFQARFFGLGPGFEVQDGRLKGPLPDQLIITWKAMSGLAPQRIEVSFWMTHGKVPLEVPLNDRNGNPHIIMCSHDIYVVTRPMLEDAAFWYVARVNGIQAGYDANNPIKNEDSVKVMVQPVPIGGFIPSQDGVEAANSLKIVPTHR